MKGQGMTPLFGGETPPRARGRQPDPIEEMVGALTDPIVVFPSGWEETLPERLKQELPLRRLAHIHQCLQGEAAWDEACDLEALIYLYPASLAAPMTEQWTRIYLYLGTRCMGDRFPEDIRQDRLSDRDMGELRDLKRWIQRKKVEARRERRRQEEAEKKEVEPAQYEQMKFF